MKSVVIGIAGSLAVLVSGCSGSPSRVETLQAIRQESAIPGFGRVAATLTELEAVVADRCGTNPSASPRDLERELAKARAAWKETEAYWAGPVMDRRAWAWIADPGDAERVEALLAASEPKPIAAEYIRSRVSAGQRGLEAVEILAHSSEGAASRRCQYLRAVATVASDEADAVLAAWRAGGEDVIPEGVTVDEIVGDAIALLMAMDRRLAGAIRDRDLEDDFFASDVGLADQSADDLRAGLRGLRDVLVGSTTSPNGSGGLTPLLDDEIVAALERKLAAAEAASAHLRGSLKEAAADDAQAVETVRRRTMEVQRLVATQVVSHLGVTVGFSDADGDTG